jgi:NitT/TauT family transport system permease protein
VRALVTLFREYDFAGDIWISVYRVVLGFVLSAAIAVPVGLLMGASQSVEALIEPINDFLRYLPVVAFVPLCILWVGIGDASKVMVIFLGTYFQLVLMVAAESQDVRKEFVEMALTHGAGRRDILLDIVVPACLPGIIDSLRIAMGWAWSYLVVAELIAAQRGIGFKIMQGLRFLKTDQVIAAIVVLGILGLAFDLAFKAVHHACFGWKRSLAE